jgi:hypothetical protein
MSSHGSVLGRSRNHCSKAWPTKHEYGVQWPGSHAWLITSSIRSKAVCLWLTRREASMSSMSSHDKGSSIDQEEAMKKRHQKHAMATTMKLPPQGLALKDSWSQSRRIGLGSMGQRLEGAHVSRWEVDTSPKSNTSPPKQEGRRRRLWEDSDYSQTASADRSGESSSSSRGGGSNVKIQEGERKHAASSGRKPM